MSASRTAEDLRLFVDNDSQLYRQQTLSIFKNLATKKARGEYTHAGAVKLFGYLAEAGAKKFAKEAGGVWNQLFSVPTRREASEQWAQEFETEYALGNYDHLLPKKYQAGPKSSAQLDREIAEKVGTRSKRAR